MEGRNLGCGNWLSPSLCGAGDLIPSSPARSFRPTTRGRDPSVNSQVRWLHFIINFGHSDALFPFSLWRTGRERVALPMVAAPLSSFLAGAAFFLPAAAEPSCTGLDGFVLAEVMAAVCFQLWLRKALSCLLTPALGKITFQLCNSSSKSCT